MNVRQLRYFVKVVQTRSMTRAAEQLYVAQPALGMQIRQLEEDLGVALLVRHSRGVEPTAAGTLLHDRALAILRMIEEVRREVATCDPAAGETIRLGLTPALMLVLGPDIALNARERAPQVVLRLTEEMSHLLADSLLRDEIDIALAYDVPDLPQLQREPLLREDLVLVTAGGVGNGSPVPFVEALEESLVLPEPRDTVRELVMRTARELGIDPIVRFEVRSISAMRSLIARGVAAGVLPMAAVAEDVRAGRLCARRIVRPALRRTLYLATLSKRSASRSEPAIAGIIRRSLDRLGEVVGDLAEPL